MVVTLPLRADGKRPRERTTTVRVLHTLRRTSYRGTSYTDLVFDRVPDGVEYVYFSWATALLGRYDVLHAHWPELLVRDARRPWLRVLRRRLLDLLLLRLRVQGVPLVWTAHNVKPHEDGPAAEARVLARFARQVDASLTMTDASPVRVGRERVTIPHAHYRHLYGRALPPTMPTVVPGRLLHFGIIRPYKGVDRLLTAFEDLEVPGATLHIAGHPHPGQAELVETVVARDPRVTAVLRYLADGELAAEIVRSQLVVLPYRGQMHNSGTLLAALSLGRPVLVPRSPTNTALAQTVGPEWIIQYDGDLSASTLSEALTQTAWSSARTPDLSAHDPDAVASAHLAVYRRLLSGPRRR